MSVGFRAALSFMLLGAVGSSSAPVNEAIPNNNRISGGRLVAGVLSLDLDARETVWYPEGQTSPGIPIYAFAEKGKQAQVPAPLVRVPAGTEIRVTIRNSLPKAMIVRGFQDRQASQLDTLDILPGAERHVEFTATTPGTYYYWGRTDGNREGASETTDAELVGAFVVDPPGAHAIKDRVMVVSMWRDTLRTIPHPAYKEAPTINGRGWPNTERLSYTTGDTVNFRVINSSPSPHPMHLHGFYFKVNSRGDAVRDTVYTVSQRRNAVTEFMRPQTTMTMSWVPTRPGNWLFHCHLIFHIARSLKLLYDEENEGHVHLANHALDGMSGLVVGIHVSGPRGITRFPTDPVAKNRLRLFVDEKPNVYGNGPGYAFVLQEGSTPPAIDSIRLPSSTIIIKKNEPTEITVFNRAHSPVSIHWHGIELQSYYDGVGDWSGWQSRTAPVIMPGDSFVVRMTPDRAGTFIYHTHTDENVQLTSGLYGPLIVLDSTGRSDPNDRIMLMGNGGPGPFATPFYNGSPSPPPIDLNVGSAHRIRFVNITPAGIKRIRLLKGDTVQTWRAVAKDGYDLPPAQANMRPADFVSGPGETMDFEIKRTEPQSLVMEFTTVVQAKVISVVKVPVNMR
jgi:FtsP/CotA-like multicopper oxidase with cupredoxin domain